jgi:hypothetical protein
VAGAVNSVAGGGTLITFPALLAAGQTALVANATNTAALWPGSASSLWGYRSEIQANRRMLGTLFVLSLAGGILGAWLLLVTPTKMFDRIVPFLVLAATLLFLSQERITRWIRARSESGADSAVESGSAEPSHSGGEIHLGAGSLVLLLITGIYGGYFGAGIGIMTLAALSFVGFRNIHEMNGVKNFFTMFVNVVAAVIFMAGHKVNWEFALVMAVGAIIGGYAGAGIARKIGQKNVRRIIIGIGFVLTASLLVRSLERKEGVTPPIDRVRYRRAQRCAAEPVFHGDRSHPGTGRRSLLS